MARTVRRVVIGGAGGFLGGELRRALEAEGAEVRTIGRSGADASWDDPEAILALVDGADAVIGLAGKRVDCRYTERNRAEILRSRVETTAALARAIAASERPPAVWLNASTATIYRAATDRPQDEATGEIGSGFSENIAESWERALFAPALPHTRRVAMRISIVLGDGPASGALFRLARLGLGGTQYDGPWPMTRRLRGIGARPTDPVPPGWARTRGRQRFSWIHVDDLVAAVRFLLSAEELSGPVNVTSPEASDNRSLMRTLRRVVGAPIGLPAPRPVLEVGTWALRSEAEMVLKSRWVRPSRLLDAGFVFAWTDLEGALRDVDPGR